ncbi:hypothetical protein SBRY_50454 [Actinacidiphila bryophytorum]|uniref:Uncharacterized protein n=1 Tax=Actinacidiphila bryophytorum TaxID=1436133 RepID=A0A9W4H4V6_9ACTN|nr:hypothetical protein SBRY_50454 [Actinacidiphila bryophytorum]
MLPGRRAAAGRGAYVPGGAGPQHAAALGGRGAAGACVLRDRVAGVAGRPGLLRPGRRRHRVGAGAPADGGAVRGHRRAGDVPGARAGPRPRAGPRGGQGAARARALRDAGAPRRPGRRTPADLHRALAGRRRAVDGAVRRVRTGAGRRAAGGGPVGGGRGRRLPGVPAGRRRALDCRGGRAAAGGGRWGLSRGAGAEVGPRGRGRGWAAGSAGAECQTPALRWSVWMTHGWNWSAGARGTSGCWSAPTRPR